jgi:hypothetical protein
MPNEGHHNRRVSAGRDNRAILGRLSHRSITITAVYTAFASSPPPQWDGTPVGSRRQPARHPPGPHQPSHRACSNGALCDKSQFTARMSGALMRGGVGPPSPPVPIPGQGPGSEIANRSEPWPCSESVQPSRPEPRMTDWVCGSAPQLGSTGREEFAQRYPTRTAVFVLGGIAAIAVPAKGGRGRMTRRVRREERSPTCRSCEPQTTAILKT